MAVEKYIPFFEENCKEDEADVITVCQTASQILHEKFKIKYNDPRLLASTFVYIYETIMDKLVSLEADNSDVEINFHDRVVIGFTSSTSDKAEKQGNFMIYMKHLDSNKKYDGNEDPTKTAVERSVEWNELNINKNYTRVINDISIAALDRLKEIEVYLSSSELIMPTFIMVYETLVKYLKTKRNENNEFEYEINFISCFSISARQGKDDMDVIVITPSINDKLKHKDDLKGSSKYE